VRMSFGCYNDHEDVDRLVEMLRRVSAGDYQGEYQQQPASGEYLPLNYQEPLADYFLLQG
jgi:hypothetical protein